MDPQVKLPVQEVLHRNEEFFWISKIYNDFGNVHIKKGIPAKDYYMQLYRMEFSNLGLSNDIISSLRKYSTVYIIPNSIPISVKYISDTDEYLIIPTFEASRKGRNSYFIKGDGLAPNSYDQLTAEFTLNNIQDSGYISIDYIRLDSTYAERLINLGIVKVVKKSRSSSKVYGFD